MSLTYELVMYNGIELKPCMKVSGKDLYEQIRLAESFVQSKNYYCEITEFNSPLVIYRTDNIGTRMKNHNNFSKLLGGVKC